MHKKLYALALPLLIVAALLGGTAQAQNLKVGYTDHEVIIVNMPEYQTIQQQLQQDVASGQQEIQAMYQDFQEKLDRYQKQQPVLSEEMRQQREQELAELQNTIQQTAAGKEQELGQREMELMGPIFERVQAAIDKVSQEEGLDLVLRTQVGQQPVILYVNQDTIVDITMEVAQELGLDVTEEDATASAPSSSN